MIEIRHRFSGKVLYAAENAQDVRAAVREAVQKRADLWEADLRRADLWEADLRGANLREADLRRASLWGANLREADLRRASLWEADLRRADLRGADLRGADLREADLRRADLRRASLWEADLRRADLRGADLRGADGINPHAVNDLLILKDQVGKIRAYKLVMANGEGPYTGGIRYEVGKSYSAKDADTDEQNQCGAGINLATLPWCIANWTEGHRILLCEFTAKDIAAIPIGDGKFRVHKCKVIRELDLDEIGLGERSQ